MKWFLPIIFIALFSCSNEKVQESEPVDSSPPSLQNEDNKSIPKYLELSEKQAKELNLKYIEAQKKITQIEIAVPGTVYPDPNFYSEVSSPISGRISKIYAHEGDRVNKEQVIAEMQSLEYASMISDFVSSEAEKDYYFSQLERLTKLTEHKISSQSELEKIKSEYQRAAAINKGMRSKLLSIGLDIEQINSFVENTNITDPIFLIKAPIAGIINKHLIEVGQSVQMYQKLMDIIDSRKVLIKGFLSPDDATLVEAGDTVYTFSQQQNNRKMIKSVINSVSPALDNENKSVIVNIYADTRDGYPRPGENVRLSIMSDSDKEVVSVPLSAITYFGDVPTVFVQHEPNKLEIRQVKICRTTDTIAVLCEGAESGEKIITNQIFSLKALTKYSEFAD
jgi:cobalt-zinc-cadmium efflux system membrane fusion protein